MKYRRDFIAGFLIIIFFLCFSGNGYAVIASMSSENIQRIGNRIFENEGASREECLVEWSEGEDFLSLGIGHFIWYPEKAHKNFEESFPDFLKYARSSNITIPMWISIDLSQPCPWNSRNEFLRSQDDVRLSELRKFLIATKPIQAAFIVKRLDEALPIILKNVPEKDRKRISAQFNHLASSQAGVFALIDYINFKGLGISPSERYHGKGWGLLQVLSNMRDGNDAADPLKEFVDVAKKILEERVANSPPERNEKKWLSGWQNRVESYLKNRKEQI